MCKEKSFVATQEEEALQKMPQELAELCLSGTPTFMKPINHSYWLSLPDEESFKW